MYSAQISCDASSGAFFAYDGCYRVDTTLRTYVGALQSAVQANSTLAPLHSEAHSRWMDVHLSSRGLLTTKVWAAANSVVKVGSWKNLDNSKAYFPLSDKQMISESKRCGAVTAGMKGSAEDCITLLPSLQMVTVDASASKLQGKWC